MATTPDIAAWLKSDLPLIAILRGIDPWEVADAGDALFEHGFRIIEVPLNSPQPFKSIARLTQSLGDQALVGAGTVTTPSEVDAVAEAGGRLVVSPHFDSAVVERTQELGLAPLPGGFTASEMFAAYQAGARAVKIFPSEAMPATGIKALATVKPHDCALLPVGGITSDNLAAYLQAGAAGAGLGSALYRPGINTEQLVENANAFVRAVDRTR